ncbi:MAG: hypothetical protein WCA46_01495, partial [Actinocatenispora sp.]
RNPYDGPSRRGRAAPDAEPLGPSGQAAAGTLTGSERGPGMAARMDPERARKLQALAAWHREWSEKHADTADFRPEGYPDAESDYNLHHVDVHPDPAAEAEFMTRARQIMGLDPETGRSLD